MSTVPSASPATTARYSPPSGSYFDFDDAPLTTETKLAVTGSFFRNMTSVIRKEIIEDVLATDPGGSGLRTVETSVLNASGFVNMLTNLRRGFLFTCQHCREWPDHPLMTCDADAEDIETFERAFSHMSEIVHSFAKDVTQGKVRRDAGDKQDPHAKAKRDALVCCETMTSTFRKVRERLEDMKCCTIDVHIGTLYD